MIKIILYKDSQKEYRGFQVSGHADYADYGKDIVCASVSALTLNMVNSVEAFTGDKFEVESKEMIRFMFTGKISAGSKLLLQSLVLGLTQIKEEYGKNYIQISIEEV